MNISKKDKNVRFHEPVIIRTNDDITPSTSSSAIDNDNGCCYHDDVEEYIGDDSLIWYTNEEIRNMEQDLQQTLERIVYDKSVNDDPRGLEWYIPPRAEERLSNRAKGILAVFQNQDDYQRCALIYQNCTEHCLSKATMQAVRDEMLAFQYYNEGIAVKADDAVNEVEEDEEPDQDQENDDDDTRSHNNGQQQQPQHEEEMEDETKKEEGDNYESNNVNEGDKNDSGGISNSNRTAQSETSPTTATTLSSSPTSTVITEISSSKLSSICCKPQQHPQQHHDTLIIAATTTTVSRRATPIF